MFKFLRPRSSISIVAIATSHNPRNTRIDITGACMCFYFTSWFLTIDKDDTVEVVIDATRDNKKNWTLLYTADTFSVRFLRTDELPGQWHELIFVHVHMILHVLWPCLDSNMNACVQIRVHETPEHGNNYEEIKEQ